MPNVTEPITTTQAGGFVLNSIDAVSGGAALAQQSADAASGVTSLSGRVGSLESGATSLTVRVSALESAGGSNPDVQRGPFVAGVLSSLTNLTSFTAAELGVAPGEQATLGIRVQGSTSAGNQLTRSLSFAVSNVGGVLSTPSFDAGADITAGSLQEAEAGWSTSVHVAVGGGSIEVQGLAGTATSVWRVSVWVSSLAALAESAATTQEVTLTAASATSVDVPVVWVLTTGITGVFASQSGTLPGSPTWLTTPPATVAVAGAGAQTIYYWGRHATGNTARKQATVQVVLDAVRPTITAFVLPATSTTLSVNVTTLTASEAVTWHYQVDNGTLTNPTWGAAPTTITFATTGAHTVYMWCRDLAENVVLTPSTQACTISQTLYTDLFNAANADWTGYNSPVFEIAGGNLHRTDIAAYRQVYNMCGGALPADYVTTWRFLSAELAGGFLGWAVQYNSSTHAGVQVFWANSTPASSAPSCGYGTLSESMLNGTWSGPQALPSTWATPGIVHQVSIASATVGSTTTYTLYLDGVLYGAFTGTTSAAARGIAWVGTSETVGSSRNMMDVSVTTTVPAYNATP